MRFKVSLFNVIFFFIITSGFAQNREKLDQFWIKYNSCKNDTLKFKIIFTDIGPAYIQMNPDSALLLYNQSSKLLEGKLSKLNSKNSFKLWMSYKYLFATSLYCIGTVHQSRSSYNDANIKYEFAIKQYSELLYSSNLWVKQNALEGTSRCLINIGLLYIDEGKYDLALAYAFKALKIVDKLNNKLFIAQCYNNIAIVHAKQNNINKSLEYLLISLKYKEEASKSSDNGIAENAKRAVALAYNNIGLVYKNKKDYKKAIDYYNKAILLNEKMGNKKLIASNYNNLGSALCLIGNFEDAFDYYLKALKIREEMGDLKGVANVYSNLAISSVELADSLKTGNKTIYYNKAIDYGLKAYDISLNVHAVPMQNEAASTLITAYKKVGNIAKAFQFSEIFIVTKDSLFSEEKTKALAEMNSRYETEKKQLLIDNLNKENALKQAELLQSKEKSKKQMIIIWSFVAGFLIILFFSIVISRLFVQKKNANILLAKQKKDIEQKNTELQSAYEEINTQKEEIETQRDTVTYQKESLEEIHREVTDSINYAKRIQDAVLPLRDASASILSEHFILFKPKDIVSGDFYWTYSVNEFQIVAVADCTGHGVPGAFMSMLGISFLNEIVIKKGILKPDLVLNELRTEIINALHRKGSKGEISINQNIKDGMDIVFITINTNTFELQYAGANNPLYIMQGSNYLKNEIESNFAEKPVHNFVEIKPDKMPVSYHDKMQNFTCTQIQLQKGDRIYLITDGFSDQFGGPNRKRFLSRNFKNLLIDNYAKPMSEQLLILDMAVESWKKEYIESIEQTDDITVLGIKI